MSSEGSFASDTPKPPEPPRCNLSQDPNGDFARIIPVSPLARRSFYEVASALVQQTDPSKHATQYIHFHFGTEEGMENDKIWGWCGYYRLNMDIPPHNPRLGWIIGSSRRKLKDTDVDILLTSSPGQHSVRGRHARLQHNKESGVLMLLADFWPTWVDGKMKLRNEARAICETTGIMLGDLNYTVELTELDAEYYKEQLVQFLEAQGQAGQTAEMLEFLTPTPTPSLRVLPQDNYYIFPTHSGGVSSTVSRAFAKSTGMIVALKKMKRAARNASAIQTEVEIMKHLQHVSVSS